MTRFELNTQQLRSALTQLGATDQRLSAAVALFGFPAERRQPAVFATLARALVGQQVSVKAAASIYARVLTHFDGDFDLPRVTRTRIATLRRLGLSERKAESLRGLAKAALDGSLPLEAFHTMSNDAVIERISAIKGFGVWSAQMYLIFSLGRPDVWPVGDLGVRKGRGTCLNLTQSPTPREAEALGEAYSPHRSSLAIFCWHICNNPTV
jgi:DNA-3-methyladenine glycosylase II